MTPEALSQTHLAAFGEDKAWSTEIFAKLLSDTSVIVAGSKDGFVLGRVTLDEAEILTVATATDKQRQGLAKAALAAFLDRAERAGATSVVLEVAEDNTAAKHLYEHAGFSVVGERKNYYRTKTAPAVTALILRRDLPTS